MKINVKIVVLVLFILNVSTQTSSADNFREEQHWLQQHEILQAQQLTKGAGVKVAVIDSGIDVKHPDLQNVVVGGTDVSGVGNSEGTLPIGNNPDHGTLVASLIAGRGHATSEDLRLAEQLNIQLPEDMLVKSPIIPKRSGGILGVAPETQLLSISAWLGEDVPGNVVSVEEQIPKAIYWAVDNGANIINMSLGGKNPAWPQSWDAAFSYAEEKKVLIVVAAGNGAGDNNKIAAPATIPGVLAVAGVDEKNKISLKGSSQGITVGIAAASENLRGALAGGGYGKWSGTSGAAAIVSGVSALVKSKFVDIDANNIAKRLTQTAQKVGDVIPNTSYGWGVLQASQALEAEVETVSENPLGSITDWMKVHRRNSVPNATPNNQTSIFDQNTENFVPTEVPFPLEAVKDTHNSLIPLTVFVFFGVLFFVVFLFGSISIRRVRKTDGSP